MDKTLKPAAAEALQQAIWRWEHRVQTLPAGSSRSRPLSIALSREAGAQGLTLAYELGKRLNWPVYDRELVEQIAADVGIQGRLVDAVDERSRSWLSEIFESLCGVPHVADNVYAHRLVSTILALGSHGECVIVGRGATAILPSISTLRVRLVAPLEHRVAVLQKRLGIDQRAARAKVHEQDKQRSEFVRNNFHCDPEDPANYDLLLNSDTFSLDECAELIIEALQCRQRRHAAN